MTPTKLRGSKHFAFNRVIRGVGRIQKSSGTADTTEFRYRDGILTKLKKDGAIETLRLFKVGRLTIEDLIDADRRGILSHVASKLIVVRPLRPEVEEWLPVSAQAAQGRRRYQTSWEAFFRVARQLRLLKRDALVADLARLDYRKLRKGWNGGSADWNRARAAVSAFLTAFFGEDRFHPFRLEVMRKFRTEQEPEGRMPDVTVKQFWRIIDKADLRCAPAYVAMAVLGTGPAEYLALKPSDLNPDTLSVSVQGTKTRYRPRRVSVDERLWTWVVRAIPSPLHYRWLNIYWHRACEKAKVTGLRMYDLRHLSAQFAGDRGATDRDLTIHMGHSDPKMSHRYSRRATAKKVARAAADALLEDAG